MAEEGVKVPGLRGRRALVTGGRGFIGAALCRQLVEAGAEVHTVGRSQPGTADDARAHVCDLQDIDATRALFDTVRPDYVFHLASHVLGARTPEVVLSTYHSNLTTTVNLLVAAHEQQCRRVLLTGSLEEPDPSLEWSIPSSPYAAAKSAAGAYGRMFHALFGLPVVILRVFMVYGPGQNDIKKLIPYVITSLLNEESPTFTSGAREVDWIYVNDVAEAFVKAAIADGIEGATVDVGSGQLASVREVVEHLYRIMDAREAPVFGSVSDRPMEQVRKADTVAAERMMGWQTRTTLEEGLRATADWYRRRHNGS